MGQPIAVTEKPGARHGLVRFELNRSLTGMGHERYRSAADATGDRPPDELARRLFATERVVAVHVYASVVTVELASGASSEGLKEIVERLYLFYPDALGESGPAEVDPDPGAVAEGEGPPDGDAAAPDAVGADGG